MPAHNERLPQRLQLVTVFGQDLASRRLTQTVNRETDMSQTQKRQPKYRHVAPALALMTTVVVAMAGITVARVARIPAETPWAGVPHAEAVSDVLAQRMARDAA